MLCNQYCGPKIYIKQHQNLSAKGKITLRKSTAVTLMYRCHIAVLILLSLVWASKGIAWINLTQDVLILTGMVVMY